MSGLNPSGLGINRSFGETDHESLSAGSVSTVSLDSGTIGIDYSEKYPQWPRQPEASGPLNVKPHPKVDNPVLTASDVSDRSNVDFVADPFVVYDHDDGQYHMFIEVLHNDSNFGGSNTKDIGHATSADGLSWSYDQIVLTESESGGGKSLPFVFKYGGDWYLIPVRSGQSGKKIFKWDGSHSDYSTVAETVTGSLDDDIVFFEYPGSEKVWAIQNDGSTDQRLYYNDAPVGQPNNWTEHPDSPKTASSSTKVENVAGRPWSVGNDVAVPLMENERTYGDKVRVWRITDLTTSNWSWQESTASPIIQSTFNGAWNDAQMHHIDAVFGDEQTGTDIVAVDGNDGASTYAIGIYTTAAAPVVHARARNPGQDTLASGGGTKTLSLNTREFDYNDAVDTSNNEIIIPESGLYRLYAKGKYFSQSSDNTPFRVILQIDVNGSQQVKEDKHINQNNNITFDAETHTYLNSGDTISVSAYQNSGADQDVRGVAEIERVN